MRAAPARIATVSRITGLPHEPCTLRSAHTALAEAVRRAVKPRPIWLAGLCYPTLGLLIFFGWQIALGADLQDSNRSPCCSCR